MKTKISEDSWKYIFSSRVLEYTYIYFCIYAKLSEEQHFSNNKAVQ